MKKARFQQLLKDQADALMALTATKGNEYANSEDDQLANFRRLGNELSLPMEKVLSVYLTKHIDSIKSWLKGLGKEKQPATLPSEPIEGRIDDAILYLILLKAMIIEKKESGRAP